MKSEKYPFIPLRDVVVFPHMVVPLFVGRKSSVIAMEHALAENSRILLSAQKKSSVENPGKDDVYKIGTLARVMQMIRMADNTVKVLVEGVIAVKVYGIDNSGGYFSALYEPHRVSSVANISQIAAVKKIYSAYVKLERKIPADILHNLGENEDALRFAYTVAANTMASLEDRQFLLERESAGDMLSALLTILQKEVEIKKIEKEIRGQVKQQMDKNQREYYLNEKIKAINKELGKGEEDIVNENEVLSKKITESGAPKEVREKLGKELKKLKLMTQTSPEAGVIRGFIETALDVPWKKKTRLNADIKKARTILDEDHYGLEEIKERIVEYLAVQKRVKHMKSPILCLVGPPGVGKTSLGRSIARATGRKYIRMSLGGVRDEAEIRGHRRTYIGSMPGRIIQKMIKAGVVNPLFLLDEIDKMAMDFRGDPASALLEVLDPEQNNTFNDHYLEFDYDLSKVMFVATSNSMNIPEPLLDRMELIRIPGYTEYEKEFIAEGYLIPRQLEKHGIKSDELEIKREAVRDIIRYYTREAGVRGLEREIAKIMRKAALEFELGAKNHLAISPDKLEKYLEVRKFRYGQAEEDSQVGRVIGLAWTPSGGDLLTIESTKMTGKGKFMVTGQLGDVMQESSQAALSVVRNRAEELGVRPENFENHDIHIHVPEGAIPKDGPSAGISMCTALVSIMAGIKVRSDVAMTGEITLRGEVLPIGGLKEKLLAAHRGGIKTVVIPEENRKDLGKIPKNILADIKTVPVKWIDEVLEIALVDKPRPLDLFKPAGNFKGSSFKRVRAH